MIKIYIQPFWAGVLLTLIIEIVIVMIVAYVSYKRFENEMEDEKNAGSTQKRD